MASNHETSLQSDSEADRNFVEMPRPTASPLVLCLGLTLLAAGAMLGLAFLVVGALVLVTGLGMWLAQLLPGRGHLREARAELRAPGTHRRRPMPVTTRREGVEQLRPGMPGYRARLPEAIHPVSAGIKGGIIGGLVMPLPAFLYGLVSRHGIWYPVNLLAGMALPGVGKMSEAQLEQFSLPLLLTGIVIHAMISVVFGLLYGVLLPTLPDIPRPRPRPRPRPGVPGAPPGAPPGARLAKLPPVASSLAWGGLIFPIFWSSISYSLMGMVNPALQERVNWPWFIVSQFVFGMVAAIVVGRSEKIPVPAAGRGPL